MIKGEGRKPTTLYRLFSDDGALLYVGQSFRPFLRLKEHQRHQLWWNQVASITVEHYSSASLAKEAEKNAIKLEKPEFNIVHQDSSKLTRGRSALAGYDDYSPAKEASQESRKASEFRWIDKIDFSNSYSGPLWLEPEPNGISSVSHMLEDLGGWDQFELISEYVRWLEANDLFNDELTLHWRVSGADKYYKAPFQSADRDGSEYSNKMTFLEYFSTPVDLVGNEVNWFSLPVRLGIWTPFWSALGWKPSALQDRCKFRSIVYELGYH